MSYLPHTQAEVSEMLSALGLSSTDELFKSLPPELLNPAIALPSPLSEAELVGHLQDLANRNQPLTKWDSFLGAGAYHRYIPALVSATISRPEFYSAYTPYQAEASQGTLQTIFEFQTLICELTGLDVANASMYDGATAAAEALLLAVNQTGRTKVAVSPALSPEYLQVIETYMASSRVAIDYLPLDNGQTDIADSQSTLGAEHAAILVAQPNFFGVVEEVTKLSITAKAVGAMAIMIADPIAATVLQSASEAGYDIAIGDGQQLGIPLSFGGPYVGFMAVRQELARRLPGRLVGMTTDSAGERAYTLTLQTREQHIRREKATSNICTNHALMALAATVYMAQLGNVGMQKIAHESARKAHHLAEELVKLPGFSLAFPQRPFLYEFVLQCPEPASEIIAKLREQKVIAGYDLGDKLLVTCTEMNSDASMERYIEAAKETCKVAQL